MVVAEVARKYDDARAMLLIGKGALRRGFALDAYAFPTNGIPDFRMVGPAVDKSVVYSIARQESAFNPRAVSSANALGLMQVLPGTGKLIAKKFGFAFDRNRMLSDASYNAQMGAAELGDVLESYRGSYILSFVAYNAGRGRVKQWIEKIRRSARSGRRSDRLGRAHPVLRDAQLRAARAREHAGLSRPARQRLAADDRGGPAPRRRRELITSRAPLPYAPFGERTWPSPTSSTEADADETGFRSLFVTAPDGLRLHVRRYGERRARAADRLPARPHAQRRRLP